jgi:hypothetical protein
MSVFLLNVILLNVTAKCRFAFGNSDECHGARHSLGNITFPIFVHSAKSAMGPILKNFFLVTLNFSQKATETLKACLCILAIFVCDATRDSDM